MGRSSKGKSQEDAQLAANNSRRKKDYAQRDAEVGKYDASVDNLAANPGFTPQDLESMRTENADQIHSVYGDEAEQVRRNSAQTGYGNDAGLLPQLNSITDERGRMTAMGQNSVAGKQASAVLDTRRMIPSMRFQPATLYQSDASGQTNANTGLITGRMSADNAPPLWAQLAQQGMQSAGTVGAAAVCWIAEVLYGVDDPRTHLLRSWLNDEFKRTRFGRAVMWLYRKYGARVAVRVKRSRFLRAILTPLFELALSAAYRDRSVQCPTA